MPIKRIKLIMFVSLLLFGLLGGISMKTMAHKLNDPEAPIRKTVVAIDKSQHEQLFEKVRRFADRHAFAIRIAPTTPSGEDFIIQLWREDIKVIGVNSFDPGEFEIFFYENDDAHKISDAHINVLIDDLKNFVCEIPGATFSERID